MQKVIIISYFFSPANFVGGERPAGWAKYFHDNNLYPIIITRNWNDNQKDLVDEIEDNKYHIEKTDHYEIHRLPYKRSLRDKISKYKQFRLLQKILTFKELIFSNFFINSLPYSNFYYKSKELLKSDSSIIGVIATGRPFNSFFIGYKLKQEFNILWIPDYRDEWSTNQVLKQKNIVERLLFKLGSKSEIKWTSNATFFTTVSNFGLNRIQDFINIKGYEIKNGYDELNKHGELKSMNNSFSIAYIGTLYGHQKIELFIDAFIKIKKEYPEDSITCSFIGVEVLEDQLLRLKGLITSDPSSFKLVPRTKKKHLANLLNNYDLFLATKYENLKGVLPVKLFDYFASGVPTLLYPSDDDVMEEFINKTNSGYVVSSEEDCISILRELIEKKKKGLSINKDHNYEFGKLYSREYQTKLFSDAISKNINTK